MSNQHTKEPWQLGESRPQPDSHVVLIRVNEYTAIATGNPEDAHRTVACVNYCEGLTTEYLLHEGRNQFVQNALVTENAMLKRKNEDLRFGLRQLLEDCRLSKRLANTAIFVQGLLKKMEE